MTGTIRATDTGAERLVRRIHERVAGVGTDLPVRLWTGETLGPTDRGYRLVLRQPWALRVLLTGDEVDAGEAYLSDAIDVEGSMVAAIRDVADLRETDVGLLTKLAMGIDALRLPKPPPDVAGGRWSGRGGLHTKDRDAAAVRHHYDTGNDFYATFLDERMVYSCAYFAPPDDVAPELARPKALDRAQRRKLELVCRKLGLTAGSRLLDVGCGWGALVIHAAEHHGARAVGITLSQAQAELARERVAAKGLHDRVRIEVRDYRDIEGEWDAIASIGMVEHVGVGQLDEYFAVLAAHLRPGGRLLNHGITTGMRPEPRDMAAAANESFIASYVFPDGALVPSATMVARAERAGLEVVDLEQLRPHYARTLQHWVHRLEQARDQAVAVAPEEVYRVWRAYMAGSADGFDRRDLGVIQLVCVKDGRVFARDWGLGPEE